MRPKNEEADRSTSLYNGLNLSLLYYQNDLRKKYRINPNKKLMNFTYRLTSKLRVWLSPKFILVMKLTTLALILAFGQVSAKGYSQKITLHEFNVPLKKVLRSIEAQSPYVFFYDSKDVEQPINIHVRNASIEEALAACLKNVPLSYKIVDRTILLQQKPEVQKAPVVTLGLPPIKGKITDNKGTPLSGATVSTKDGKKATVTGDDGSFELKDVNESDILVISYTGYAIKEISAKAAASGNIVLSEYVQNLNDVVVVGYGTQKKVNLTGAVAMVTAEAFESRPITSVSTGLQGLLPGLAAVSFTGQPGSSNATLRIRGVGSTNNSAPFVVVDGIPGDLNYLNPDDIESVSVLKDAASAAIYGSRAANGVILITTKRGRLNLKPVVNYDGYVGVQMPTALPKMLGSVEYMQYLNESQKNVGLAPTFTDAQIETARNGTDPNFYANTNWPEALFKSYAPQQNHNISLTGGSADLSYYMSYARQDQQGLVVGNQYDANRNNLRLRLNSNKILNIIDVDANIGFIDRLQNQPADETVAAGGPIYQTLTASPLTPVYFTNGTYGYGGGSANPVATATVGGFNKLHSQDFTGNVSGTVHILKNLSARLVYGLTATNQNATSFARKVDYYDPNTNAFLFTNRASNLLQNSSYKSRLENTSAQLNYELSVGNNHLKALAGYQQEQFRYETFSASKTNFVSDEVPILDLGSANPLAGGNAYQYALRSYFGRINYDYLEKYLLEFNLRYDGSSRYAPENRYGAFPSASAGWRFTQEDFIRKANFLDWLNEGKIRGSYGTLGNQYGADGPGYSEWYPYIGVIGAAGTASTNMPIGNTTTTGLAQSILANPYLQWEKVNMLNIGIDLSMFESRLSVTGDWFDKNTTGVQLKVPQPDVIGLTVPDQNAGTVSNKGWELMVGWNDQVGGVKYGLTAQLSDVKNHVTDLGGVAPTIADRIRQVGYPIDAFYGYRTDGLAQNSDFTKDPTTGKLTPNFPIFTADAAKIAPGDIKFRDLNGDGVITADKDREVIGDAFPRYTYSLRGNVSYKNFELNFFLQGVGKANGYVTGVGANPFYANGAYPQEVHRDHWTPDNPNAWYPRFTYLDNRNTTARLSDYWLQDAKYLRLKNIQLSYTLPRSLLTRYRVDMLRFYVSADNLFTATNFFYAYDPETPSTNGGYYPQVKTIVFGVNVRLK